MVFNRVTAVFLTFGLLAVIMFLLSLKKPGGLFFTLLGITVVLFLFVTFFFRNPNRKILYNPNAVLAPCDGKVLHIYQTDSRKKVYVFLSLFDVHRFRAPVSGVVAETKYNKGRFYGAFQNQAVKENEHNKVMFKNKNGDFFNVTQIAGYIARRIICDVKQNDIVKQGDLFGLIMFGSGCLIDIPENYDLKIKKGEKIKAGINIIAVKNQ